MLGLWSRDTIAWIIVAALLPLAAIALAEGDAMRMAVVLAVAAIWQAAFRWTHGVPLSPTPVVMAVTVAILAPDLAPWQLALGTSFGIEVGELLFGGWGRNVIAAPVVVLAFLSLSFPAAAPADPGPVVAHAALATAAILWVAGILALPVIAAAMVPILLFGTSLPDLMASGPLVVGLVLLLADPVTTPTSLAGRIAYGGLAGTLTALLAETQGIAAVGPIVFATLLAQIFAPLIDYFAIAARLARRKRHA